MKYLVFAIVKEIFGTLIDVTECFLTESQEPQQLMVFLEPKKSIEAFVNNTF